MARARRRMADFSGEYEATIVARTGDAYRLPWTSLKWGRARNATSEATVAVSAGRWDGPSTEARTEGLRALEPWACTLRISRDGVVVWEGPVGSWGGDGTTIEIRARDLSAWWRRRLIAADRTFVAYDLATIFETIIDDVFAVAGSRGAPTMSVSTLGVTGGRVYLTAKGEYLADCLNELTERGVVWTMVGSTLHADKTMLAAASARCGVFTDRSFATLPKIDVDGWEMADSYVAGAQSSDAGFGLLARSSAAVDSALGLLETFESRDDLTSLADVQAFADEQYAQFRYPTLTCSTVRLTSEAPIDFDDLIPGINIGLSLDETVLLGVADLFGVETFGVDKVDVTVDASGGASEQVELTLGWETPL